MRRNFLIALICCCCSFINLSAQELRGVVMDSKQHPISYAAIQVLEANDSSYVDGGMSNEKGFFSISKLDIHKNYILKASCLGYKNLTVQASLQNEMKLVLAEDKKLLGEVIVKGKRPFMKQEGDKTVFYLKSMPSIGGLKVNDVLKYAPRVMVSSNGEIKVAGKTATVFLNDRRLSNEELFSYLSGLNASDIEKIEIQQSHGGEKDADIQGGIINIITRQRQLGVKGTLYIKGSTPEDGYYYYSPIVNLYVGKEKWNIYGMYSYEQERQKQYSETINDYLYNNTQHQEKNNYFSHANTQYYRLGAIYLLSQHHQLGIELNGVVMRPKSDESKGNLSIQDANNIYKGISSSTYYSPSDFMNVAFSYNWNFDKQNSNLKLLVNWNHKKMSSDNQLDAIYPEYANGNVKEDNTNSSNANNWSTTIDFTKNFKTGWSFVSGGRIIVSTRNSDFYSWDRLNKLNDETHWKYKENIGAAYVGIAKSFSKHWYINLNVRGEYTDVNGTYPEQAARNISKHYTDWFSYFFLSYATAKGWKYEAQYSRSVYRPPFALMNGYSNRLSDILYDKGNPNLEAALTDNFGFTVRYLNHSASVSYKRTPKDIVEYFTVEDGITYHTNINFGTSSVLALDYSYSGNILSWWQTNLYAVGQYTDIPKSYNRKHLWGGIFSWANRLYWQHIGAFTFDCSIVTHSATGNTYQKGYYSFDFSYKRMFFYNALSIQIGIDDIFNSMHQRSTNIVPVLKYHFYTERQYRNLWCKLVYNFSTRAKVDKRRLENVNSIKERL